MDSVITVKASTAIVYRLTFPKGEFTPYPMLEVNGDIKLLEVGSSNGEIDEITDGDQTTVVRRLVIPQQIKNATLEVAPSNDEAYYPVDSVEIEIP